MKPLGFSYMHLSNKKIYLDKKNVAAVAATASSSVCVMNRLIENRQRDREKQRKLEILETFY